MRNMRDNPETLVGSLHHHHEKVTHVIKLTNNCVLRKICLWWDILGNNLASWMIRLLEVSIIMQKFNLRKVEISIYPGTIASQTLYQIEILCYSIFWCANLFKLV